METKDDVEKQRARMAIVYNISDVEIQMSIVVVGWAR